ncbi:EamA family transporter [Gaiella sp.]|uniref:EamA family transporter n=1 Tax=Gaiella sp. TaxID=2663207 RepID=UPI0032647959
MARGWRIWTALGLVYVVWGSTYLAIKVSVETMPPLLSAGLRFTVAGLLLGSILALRRTPLRVPWREARAALIIGVMLLASGVGAVTLAETRIDSSVAAMIAGSVPLQVILWRTLSRERVATATKLAAVVGIGGLALIIGPAGISGGSAAIGLAIMLCGSVAWSTGSFISRGMPLPKDPFVATVYEMIGGGLVLIVAALAVGEGADVSADAISAASFAAWAYLAIFGSLVAFTAYAWLLHHAPISQVVTHQYVNPIVAIVLGSVFLGESQDLATVVGALIVIGAVFATIRSESRSAPVTLSVEVDKAAPPMRAR